MRNDTVSERTVGECMDMFDGLKKDVAVIPPEGSMLRPLADSGMEMVECYRADAGSFTEEGDLVTAFAAICYAHAWIGCFQRLGLFGGGSRDELFLQLPGSDGSGCRITEEKMARYLDITARARKKAAIASPVRSFDRRLALEFLGMSESYFGKAVEYRNGGDFVRAFAAVNYSHAWLDGGARIGLFDVGGDDVLFTLYE